MRKLRLLFSKKERAIYISHLDLMGVLQRGFLRAGYQLKYSEGYNPHPVISIALPLSLGAASNCELLDFSLMEDELDFEQLVSDLNKSLPEGVHAMEVYEPTRKASQSKWLRVEGIYEYDNRDAAEMVEALKVFYARPELPVLRKTKRGEGIQDIAPQMRELSVETQNGDVRVEAVISVNEPTVNPELLVKALQQLQPELAPDFAQFTRLEIYDADMKIFR